MEMLKAGGKKVVGTKQVLRALKAGTVKRVYAANDADTFIYQQVVRSAESAGVPCVRVPSMKELGMICGVDVPRRRGRPAARVIHSNTADTGNLYRYRTVAYIRLVDTELAL